MKKSILLLAVCAVSMSGMAQNKVAADFSTKMINKQATVMNAEMKQGPRKDLKSGVYYTRPEGTIYNGLNEEASGYGFARLFAPAFSSLKFTNMCNNRAAAVWGFNGNQMPDLDIVDGDNNLVLEVGQAGSGYYMPEIYVGSDMFKLGASAQYAQYNGVYGCEMGNYSFADQQTSDIYGFGSLSTHYTFGSGTFSPTEGDNAGKLFRSHGFVMECPAPISPLYIERFNFLVYNNMESEPIADGCEVTMQIRGSEFDAEGNRKIGGKILYELKATKADVSDALHTFDTEYSSTGKAAIYNVTFSNKTVDQLGTEVEDPMVINEPFYIVVRGHEQEGVNFGYRLLIQNPEDKLLYGTYSLCFEDSDVDLANNYGLWYGSDGVIDMSFYGGYDFIECLESATVGETTLSGINVLRVSADGKNVTNEGSEEQLQGRAAFNTAVSWFDEENPDIVNYEVNADDLPAWIAIDADPQFETGQNEDGSTYDYYTGVTYVTVECEALPAGQTGRAASLYFEGKGYKSQTPLIVLQGDATLADAIENPVVVKTNMNKGTYNLAGQKVGKNFKGIVIKNGKKEIQK